MVQEKGQFRMSPGLLLWLEEVELFSEFVDLREGIFLKTRSAMKSRKRWA